MRYLGIDPGTTLVGYGVIDKVGNSFSLVTYGCLDLPKTKKQSERLFFIKQKLDAVLNNYQPEFIALEKLFFQKNAKTVIEVAQAQGVIILACQTAKIPLHLFTPLEVKQAVTGYGRAEKRQVQQMIKSIFKMDKIPTPDDAADAIALAVCMAQTNIELKNKSAR